MNCIQKISLYLADTSNLPKIYAAVICLIAAIGICTVPFLTYHGDQLYPKPAEQNMSPLTPYDRGGVPFIEPAHIAAQYPENSPALGYVTAYLTPASWFLANTTCYLGTTIVGHPGGILDEILYYTRGLDTIVEASIFFVAFAIASFLYRRAKQ
ncbi:MAG: EhaF family protein [Methanocalculaceae archaeon]|jgi:energy-converting hydrogenase A subunit F|nr:EhaF family protein [Methanocalculaceae archaeon]